MSRAPMANGQEIDADVAVVLAEHLRDGPIDAAQVKLFTRRDPVLLRVHQFVLSGWPEQQPEYNLLPYWRQRDELSRRRRRVWGLRVVVPAKLLK